MSRLWSSPRYRVHLAADALMACEVHGHRGRRHAVRKACFPFVAGQRAAAMQSLREWMAAARRTTMGHALQEWVLGTSEVRYLLLPWTPDLADKNLRQAFAFALFEQRFQQDPGLYTVRFAKAAYGRAQLVAFVAQPLLSEIEEHARVSQVRLASVAPSLATVWDRFRPLLEKEHGVVCLVDGDRQIVVHHAQGRIGEVLLRPFDVRRREAAPSMQASDVTLRFFSSIPLRYVSPEAALSLMDGEGFLATQDAAYAFALCGVF